MEGLGFNSFNVGETLKYVQAKVNQPENLEGQIEDKVKGKNYSYSKISEETGRDVTQSTGRNIHL